MFVFKMCERESRLTPWTNAISLYENAPYTVHAPRIITSYLKSILLQRHDEILIEHLRNPSPKVVLRLDIWLAPCLLRRYCSIRKVSRDQSTSTLGRRALVPVSRPVDDENPGSNEELRHLLCRAPWCYGVAGSVDEQHLGSRGDLLEAWEILAVGWKDAGSEADDTEV
jgi:hypothetical protein